ncbi:MAG: histidine kinase, partial [Oscillospiraceae bacterium]|nr:histidine kinase [Oscillospiraceae bacterium]
MLTGLALALMLFIQAAGAAENTGAKVSVDPVNHSENYSAVLYNNRNGLPSSDANTIAQTSEGFIWIGSYSGLIRYDGNTFERLDSTNGMGSIVELFVDSRDRLWIGTNDNGLALWEDGEFTIWNDEAQLGSTKISTIEEDADGTVYIGTTMGITAISPDLTLRHLDDPRIANIYMEHITRGEDGLLYCITNEDDIFTLRNGELVEFTDHSSTKIQGITFIRPDPSDPRKLYVGTEDSRFYRVSKDFDLRSLEYMNIEPLNSVNDIVKIGDRIWICARNGIGELDDKGFHNLDNLPMNNSVNKMMVDYEGNLWFTSSRQGVMKLVSNKFTDIFVRYGLEPDVVNATCMYKGHLFIGTDTGAKVLNNDRQVYTIPLSEARTASGTDLGFRDLLKLLDGCRIRSITPDSHGRLWISTWRACGLLRYDGGRVTAFTESDGLHSNQVRAVSEMADGSMIVANTGGVNVIKGDEVVLSVGVDDGIANPETLSVCAAPNGDILLGSNGGGIYVVKDGSVRCIGREDGLTSEIIMRIKHDPMNNVFWLVTSNSIAYMTEDYKVTTVKEFPYSNNFDLYINKKGDMWILSSNGIYVVSSAEMIANGRINPVHYGLGNGLPCTATSNSYSALTPQGDLYISGSSGVAKVNIEAALEDITDLKQAVPYIEADGKLLYPDENGGFTLSPDVKKVTIYGYVFNYSLTDPQVSYILEGFDREPVTLSRSDLGPVTYTNLHGGDYRFVMVLTDALGRGENELSVPIVKEKALHEKPWFYVLLGVGAAALIALLVHAYTRRKMHILEEKHREEKEKERITNELHMANRIQGSMLPHDFPPFPDRKEFDIYADMDPA